MVIKGRNRDTAYFSITDEEWERSVRESFDIWLQDSNFDHEGRQMTRLEQCRKQ